MTSQVKRRLLAGIWLCAAALSACVSAQEVRGDDSGTPNSHSFIHNISELLQVNRRSHSSVKAPFRRVVSNARTSTVRVLCDDRATAFGTVVDSRGFVITKNSELHGHLECVLSDGRRVAAKHVASDDDYDIALLKIQATNLVPIQWSTETPQTGAWLATVSTRAVPAALGFASAEPRRIPAPMAVLGVQLKDTDDGPRVELVYSHSAAEKAELHRNDVITKVNGDVMKNSRQLSQTISRRRVGDRIQLEILRDGKTKRIKTTLGAKDDLGNAQVGIMEDLAGPLSARRTGFPVALQHDTVLRPEQCGGPLVDLSGRAVGINIARASRVASYAIPAFAIQGLLPQLMVH